MWSAVTLAIGLAMDATAVAAARAVVAPRRDLVVLPALFGAFQAGMAWLGWVTGDWGGAYFEAYDHWVAFALLAGMGGKMIVDGSRGEERPQAHRRGLGLYLALALATSMDAGAAGLALPLLGDADGPISPWVSVAWIGGVTAVLAALGFLVGRRLGDRFGPRLEIAGGVALLGIGVKILVEHLA
jgi:manganese efflux pump family protein